MEFRQDPRTGQMKGRRGYSKEYLMRMAEHHHEEEETGIEEGMKNNKNFQNGLVAPDDKEKKKRKQKGEGEGEIVCQEEQTGILGD